QRNRFFNMDKHHRVSPKRSVYEQFRDRRTSPATSRKLSTF
ncbi:7553_t:CDS:1, partial [Funneliformis mosseae]